MGAEREVRVDPTFFKTAEPTPAPRESSSARGQSDDPGKQSTAQRSNSAVGEQATRRKDVATARALPPNLDRTVLANSNTRETTASSSDPPRRLFRKEVRRRVPQSRDGAMLLHERRMVMQRRARKPSSPFATNRGPGRSRIPTAFVGLSSRQQPAPERPWGLSREDMETVNSFVEPGETKFVNQESRGVEENSSASAHGSKAMTATTMPVEKDKGLTHLTSSGEAHMVDVGAKQATKRVAIATAYVSFSNPEPFRLIAANSNKKGDVLSVARIAGIMAAKRTADLIPLCHPIAISKVEVDVALAPHGPKHDQVSRSQGHGGVAITSTVHCTGPTGVEMEALTSAMGAGLTVYDMCKAVDKGMRVEQGVVVYKSGGRSGLHCRPLWARQRGRKWFEERGLEVPELERAGREKEEEG